MLHVGSAGKLRYHTPIPAVNILGGNDIRCNAAIYANRRTGFVTGTFNSKNAGVGRHAGLRYGYRINYQDGEGFVRHGVNRLKADPEFRTG